MPRVTQPVEKTLNDMGVRNKKVFENLSQSKRTEIRNLLAHKASKGATVADLKSSLSAHLKMSKKSSGGTQSSGPMKASGGTQTKGQSAATASDIKKAFKEAIKEGKLEKAQRDFEKALAFKGKPKVYKKK